MSPTQLQQWIQHPELLNKDTLYELRTLLVRYPYFQTACLLYLKNLYMLHESDFGAELRKSVLYVADRRMLFQLIEGGLSRPQVRHALAASAEKLQKEPGVDRTLSLIDAFLATVSANEEAQTAELNYTSDYTAYLLESEPESATEVADTSLATPKLHSQELIDGFLQKNGTGAKPLQEDNSAKEKAVAADSPKKEENEDDTDIILSSAEDDEYFTETLAKIYIKQHRYEKALEIIKKLSLNYPKKNAYFADQIRFLEKLIINAKSK